MKGLEENRIPVLAVVGPTASGKTGLGIELALALGGEVISADSMQIYRGMRIATARPTEEEMRGVPHHLIGFVDPQDRYSVARYLEDAGAAIREAAGRGRLPVLVGGTGLYVDSLLDGITFREERQDESLRRMLAEEADRLGNEAMLEKLAAIDPGYAQTLHPNNRGRILRALELFYGTGVTMSEQLRISRERPSPYRCLRLGIGFSDRRKLYERIDLRVDQMLRDGLLDEVREFYRRYDPGTAAQAIGCKEFLPFLSGQEPLEPCVERLKQETRRYAKRQMTWFRRNSDTVWLLRDEEGVQALTARAVRLAREWLLKNDR